MNPEAMNSNLGYRAASKRYSWAVVGMLWLICFFNYADRQAIFSVFPLLQREFSLSQVQLGLLGSAFAWIYGLSGPVAGVVVDRIRRKTAILGGLQFWSIICGASALSRTFGKLLFFRAAEGLGEAVYYPASTSLISDYHGSKTRSKALGILVTSVYAGTVGGGFWAGAMAERHSWRFSFEILGALGCLLGLVLVGVLKGSTPRKCRSRDYGYHTQTLPSGDPYHPADTYGVDSHDGLHLRKLCRLGTANLDASLSLRKVPSHSCPGRTDGNTLSSGREHVRCLLRRISRRQAFREDGARPHDDPGDRSFSRSSIRYSLRII